MLRRLLVNCFIDLLDSFGVLSQKRKNVSLLLDFFEYGPKNANRSKKSKKKSNWFQVTETT